MRDELGQAKGQTSAKAGGAKPRAYRRDAMAAGLPSCVIYSSKPSLDSYRLPGFLFAKGLAL